MRARHLDRVLLLSLTTAIGLGWACASAPPPARDDDAPAGDPDAGALADARDAKGVSHAAPAALQRCAARGQAGAVTTIAGVVELANALERPVTIACLVAALPRPLDLLATSSRVSAQPAPSAKSPRVFLLLPGVVLSVVPEGEDAHLLEMGQWVGATDTLKAELPFPLTGATATDAPLLRIEQSNKTTPCGVCHRNERAHDTIAHGYVSAAYRPNPGADVKVAALIAEHQACADAREPSARCDLLHALFDFGAVRQGELPKSLSVFP